ncbi:DUF327 family protein [Lentibacillus sp. L22]|uniref:DUF327 family protein n=1 Tax=Lentibacillus sp. L22 TaxID=3163028 RepID=UPI0034652D16
MSGKTSFHGVIKSQTQKINHQELEQFMKNITQQGNKLAHFRSFRDFIKFRRMVKGFLQRAIKNGLILKHDQSFY